MAQIYPQWWDTTVTIYNKYFDPVSDMITWYRHVVTGAFWKYTGDKISIANVTLGSYDITCRIRKDPAFMENFEWVNLPADVKPDYFTLNRNDILVKGEVSDEINEYADGYRATDIIQKYKNMQGCMVISEITINVGGGRYTEHYLVRGERANTYA